MSFEDTKKAFAAIFKFNNNLERMMIGRTTEHQGNVAVRFIQG